MTKVSSATIASLAGGFALGALVTYWVCASRREEAVPGGGSETRPKGAAEKGPAGPSTGEPPAKVAKMTDVLTDEVLNEHFQRNIQFFGEEGQLKVAGSFVVVIGLGGVGSHAAHMLLRSGVGKLRLVDFDQVSLSSLNRHVNAKRSDVGTPKAECLVRRPARPPPATAPPAPPAAPLPRGPPRPRSPRRPSTSGRWCPSAKWRRTWPCTTTTARRPS